MTESRGLCDLDDFQQVFRALAHRARRHVLVALHGCGGSMLAGAIAKRFSCSWPTTSRHLKVLADAGLVRVERQGRELIYHLDRTRLDAVAGRWLRSLAPPGEGVKS